MVHGGAGGGAHGHGPHGRGVPVRRRLRGVRHRAPAERPAVRPGAHPAQGEPHHLAGLHAGVHAARAEPGHAPLRHPDPVLDPLHLRSDNRGGVPPGPG